MRTEEEKKEGYRAVREVAKQTPKGDFGQETQRNAPYRVRVEKEWPYRRARRWN